MDNITRPSPDNIKRAYANLYQSNLSLSKLKDAAVSNRLFTSDTMGVPGRSMAWKLFLLQQEPLEPAGNLEPSPPLNTIRNSRKAYVKLVAEKMRAPDGSYEEGFVLPGTATSPTRATTRQMNINTNNPLSLSNENPWIEYFSNLELRKTVAQDVERTFPEIDYFRDTDVQYQLTNILYIHALTHPSVGYRQGMHEILAPIYFAVDYDSLKGSHGDGNLLEYCSRTWVAADAWALFEALMENLSRWYEWREPPLTTSPDLKPTTLPIMEVCNRIQHQLLRAIDPLLWKSLQTTGIEPQIYGMRWLRLLFSREFPLKDVMILWDGLFAFDSTLDLAIWICVAMLIRIRNELISSDYTGQLSSILRYPSPPPQHESTPTVDPYALLLKQAILLQASPTATTGATIVIENRNLLNISVDIPESHSTASRRPQNRTRSSFTSDSRAANEGVGHGRHRSMQASAAALPELFARGLLERGESLGINNFMSAVSDLRRNLPELASSIVRSPAVAMDSYTAFPLSGGDADDRSPWESRGRFEIERELSALRTMNKTLSESATWILDVLQRKEPVEEERKQRALETLVYIRDALKGGTVIPLEEDKLFGGERHAPKEEPPPPPPPPTTPMLPRLPRSPPRFPSTPPVGSPPASSASDEAHQLGTYGQVKSARNHRSMSPPTPVVSETRHQPPTKPGPKPTPQTNTDNRNNKRPAMMDPLGVLH